MIVKTGSVMKNKIIAMFVVGLAILAAWLIRKKTIEAKKVSVVCNPPLKK